jgi:hypothetical protein
MTRDQSPTTDGGGTGFQPVSLRQDAHVTWGGASGAAAESEIQNPKSGIERPGSSGASALRRVGIAAAKWVLFGVVAFFVGRALARHLADLSWDQVRWSQPYLALAALVFLAMKGLSPAVYRMVLGTFGSRPPWLAVYAAVPVAQLGKYVPGKVGPIVGMAWLLRRYGIAGRAAVATGLVLTGLMVLGSLVLSVPLLVWAPVRAAVPMAWLWCLVVVAAGLVGLHPRVFGRAGNWVLARFGYPPLPRLPLARELAAPTAIIFAELLLAGASMWLLARSLAPVPLAAMPLFVSASALALTIGLAAIFAPAGLGVQEGILLAVLSPVLDGPTAAVLVVSVRLVWAVLEVLLALGGLGLLRYLCGRGAGREP